MKDIIEIDFLVENGLYNYGIIDVRSEGEFSEDHIPGAINIPLLNNEERAVVGTIYKQVGAKTAKMKGVEIVSPKLHNFITNIASITEKYNGTIIYCWRGGLRSEASVTFSRMAGLTVSKLNGGYKNYRSFVSRFFDDEILKYNFATVYGATGTGKSQILRKSADIGLPIVDLELHAHHKGSSFGAIDEPYFELVTQKNFESGIFGDIIKHQNSPIFFIEGESKKVGKITIPKNLFSRMSEGKNIIVDASLDFRIQNTIENYKPENFINEIKSSLSHISRYLNKDTMAELLLLLDKKDFSTFTKRLLVEYYDPLYRHSFPKNVDFFIKIDNIGDGVNKLMEIYNEMYS